jgi:hypothetical protein
MLPFPPAKFVPRLAKVAHFVAPPVAVRILAVAVGWLVALSIAKFVTTV